MNVLRTRYLALCGALRIHERGGVAKQRQKEAACPMKRDYCMLCSFDGFSKLLSQSYREELSPRMTFIDGRPRISSWCASTCNTSQMQHNGAASCHAG